MSRFKGFADAKNRAAEPAETGTPVPKEPTPLPSPAAKPKRPPGKRSTPGFVQVTSYLPGDLLRKVKRRLDDEKDASGKGPDLSDTIGTLLREWFERPKV